MPCRRIQVGPITGFVCTRGRPAGPTCSEAGCRAPAPYLCDHPIKPRARRNGPPQTTCDRRLCELHRVQVSDNLDHCPHHAGAAGSVERGPLVFKLELPLELAPTMNEYSHTKRHAHRMKRLNQQVDTAIMIAKTTWPRWKMQNLIVTRNHRIEKGKVKITTQRTGGRRRLVVVHRFSSREPDEVSCDVLGGKLPLDRLVQAEVLVDDNRKWLKREARWSPAPPRQGRLVLSVHELGPAA